MYILAKQSLDYAECPNVLKLEFTVPLAQKEKGNGIYKLEYIHNSTYKPMICGLSDHITKKDMRWVAVKHGSY